MKFGQDKAQFQIQKSKSFTILDEHPLLRFSPHFERGKRNSMLGIKDLSLDVDVAPSQGHKDENRRGSGLEHDCCSSVLAEAKDAEKLFAFREDDVWAGSGRNGSGLLGGTAARWVAVYCIDMGKMDC
ncbi:hypothetical protein KY290_003915 [Solanum tuberosum]|uniref:Uncharacterized protein n=1 Tax=Solanum tuberosum TaxID=4113 RepID=A0ABQ7WU79_SOLTU|nr:hypothetical protein KY284_001753 [Solanum tuberosum]KAH0784317.1 hypothetical protein KY290_003915 [Solanum tuberosum]